jgi:6,7-dimethyl-8-ribityllumazine synthase
MMKEKGSKKQIRVAIIVSRYNNEITDGLLKGAFDELKRNDVPDDSVKVFHCPGAFEIPSIAKRLCKTKKYDAVVCLGAVIKGETAHFEYISSAVSIGIMNVSLEYNVPVSFGVLTCYTEEQAMHRSQNDENNKGAEAARSALEMIGLVKTIK